MTLRFILATVTGIVAATVAPWPWLAVSIMIAMPMTLGIWMVARLTGPQVVVRNISPSGPPRGRNAR
jgi:hypothetical protein